MAWHPISNVVPQYSDSSGNPYSGAVLKAYQDGTSTPTNFATDSTGATQVSSIALNASGHPAVSGNVVIPHIDQDFKLSLYPTQAAADANSGAIWTVDNIAQLDIYDADTLKADTADILTAGFATTPYNAGTKSSGIYTPNEANGNLQYAVNGGAHTLAPMTNNGTVIIQYTNNASAGAITTSGWTKVSGSSFSTVNGDDFMCYLTVCNGFKHLNIVALQ